MDAASDSLFVLPGGVLVLDQPLGGRLVLFLGSWQVVSVEKLIHVANGGPRDTCTTSPSVDHFMHQLFKLLLDLLGLPLDIRVSHSALAAFISEDFLDVVDGALATAESAFLGQVVGIGAVERRGNL